MPPGAGPDLEDVEVKAIGLIDKVEGAHGDGDGEGGVQDLAVELALEELRLPRLGQPGGELGTDRWRSGPEDSAAARRNGLRLHQGPGRRPRTAPGPPSQGHTGPLTPSRGKEKLTLSLRAYRKPRIHPSPPHSPSWAAGGRYTGTGTSCMRSRCPVRGFRL